MGDIKVFRIDDDAVSGLPGQSMAVEKPLQTLIECHLDTFLGVRFLASEHYTKATVALRETSASCRSSTTSFRDDR